MKPMPCACVAKFVTSSVMLSKLKQQRTVIRQIIYKYMNNNIWIIFLGKS